MGWDVSEREIRGGTVRDERLRVTQGRKRD